MHPLLLVLISIGTAYLAGRLAHRGPFTLADFAIGLFGAIMSLGLAQLLGAEHVEVGPALQLLLACALPLGLGSLRRYPSPPDDEARSPAIGLGD
jgi:hypothetical protein